MEVQVLGKSPSWPDGGGACSGYLVTHDGYALLLDCGTGVLAKLRVVRDYLDVDAVLLTHLHPDHWLDLIPFASALSYSPRAGNGRRPRPALHVPPGGRTFFRRVTGAWGPEDLLETVFAMAEYDVDERLELGPLRVRFREVPHFTTTYACELGAGGRRFTFGADCAPNDALVEFARRTDLLMVEATLLVPEHEGPRGHMTPAEAGALGRRAGAGRLVVTHYSDELDAERIRSDAASAFGGEVTLATDGATYVV